MEICPKCDNHSVVYDEYYKRKICLIVDCSWSDLPDENEKKEVSIALRTSNEPVVICYDKTHIIDIINKNDTLLIDKYEDGIGTIIFTNKLNNKNII